MAAARAWLIENGIAIADQILLTGWSYGGYLTLLGLGRQPDLWAGGMAGIAIADWTMNYEDSSDLLRSYQRMLFGGDPDEKAAAMRGGVAADVRRRRPSPGADHPGPERHPHPGPPGRALRGAAQARGHPVQIEWFDAGHMGGDDELSIGIRP